MSGFSKRIIRVTTVFLCFVQILAFSAFAKQPAPEDLRLGFNFDDESDAFKMSGKTMDYAASIFGAPWDTLSNFETVMADIASDSVIFGDSDKVLKISINAENLNMLQLKDPDKSVPQTGSSQEFVWQLQNKTYTNSAKDNMWFAAGNNQMIHWSCTVMMDKQAGYFKFNESVLFDADGNVKLTNGNVNVAKWIPNKWYTVDILFDGATRRGNLYINGKCVSEDVEFYQQGSATVMQHRALLRMQYYKNNKTLDYNIYLNDLSFGSYTSARVPVLASMDSRHVYEGAYWYNGGNTVTVQKLISETSVASDHSVKVVDAAHIQKTEDEYISDGDFVVEYDESGSYVDMYAINAAPYAPTDELNTKVDANQYYDFSNPRDAYMFFVHNGWTEKIYDVVTLESGVNGKDADDRAMKVTLDSSLKNADLDIFADNRTNEYGSNGVYNGKKVELEFQFMADSLNCDVAVKSATPPGIKPAWFPVIVTFKNDGTILAGDGQTNIGRWKPNQWYTVGVCFDFTECISDGNSKYLIPSTGEIYINGVKVENTNITFNSWEVNANIDPNGFRMSITPKTGIDGKVMDCNVYFDNFKPFIYTSGGNYIRAERTLQYNGDRLGNTLYAGDNATAESVLSAVSSTIPTRSFAIYNSEGSNVTTGALQEGCYIVEKDSSDKSVIFTYNIDITNKKAVVYDSDKKMIAIKANSADDPLMEGTLYVGLYNSEALANVTLPSLTENTYVYGEDIWERTADINAVMPTDGKTTKVFLWKTQTLEPLDSPIVIR